MTNHQPIQLELPLILDLPEKEYWQQYRTPEQERNFQLFRQAVRKESAEMLALANQLILPEQKFLCLTELTNSQLAEVRSVYFPENLPYQQQQKQPPRHPTTTKPSKAYQPWSDERKFRARIRRLSVRVEKDFSIPEMRIAKLLHLCAENVQYLGLCVLPGVTDRCQVSFNIAQIAAVEKEKMLRKV
jgi:hypothetical protein